MLTTRRDFVKTASVAGAGIVAVGLVPIGSNDNKIRFLSPIDGDMLCEYDGRVENGNLTLSVKIEAPYGSNIRINGVKSKFADNFFSTNVHLKNYENIIEAEGSDRS